MRFAKKLVRWGLFVALLLTACSPASTPVAAPASTPVPSAVSNESTPTEVSQPVAVATSRGDKLEASDPALVTYGAGNPALIEFFRFT